MKDQLIVVLAAGVLTVSGQAFAHHGVSAYDVLNPITIEGTVTQYIVRNPHPILFIEVKGEDGTVVEWVIETFAPRNPRAPGGLLKAGDQVSVTLVAAKSGAPVGFAGPNLADGKVVRADGTLIVGRTPEEQAAIIEARQEN